jgi:nicotinamidase-related amidase
MWGASTPMQQWLEDNSMTTLFFGGVNIDQCVWGTLLEYFFSFVSYLLLSYLLFFQSSYYKGYDVILLDDISATTSPIAATQMVDFNAMLNGWRANASDILDALKGASA